MKKLTGHEFIRELGWILFIAFLIIVIISVLFS